jgi:hypothetical protein
MKVRSTLIGLSSAPTKHVTKSFGFFWHTLGEITP